jgi:D-sedoheptulose 7-phosphate isomerase
MLDWIKNHFNTLHDLQLRARVTDYQGGVLGLDDGFRQYIQIVKTIRANHGKLIFIGNGGSAGIASHLAIDYSKNGHLNAMTFNDASALTCLSNDFGYDHVFAKQIEYHGRKGDVLIAISSSGRSKNIINAVSAARKLDCPVITFSGFEKNNPLSQLGNVNFYVDAKEYGYVEVAHLSLGHAMLDYIIEESTHAKSNQRQVLEAEIG